MHHRNIAVLRASILMLLPLILGGCSTGGSAEQVTIPQPPAPPPPSANNAPTISGIPPEMVEVGIAYSFTPAASDPDLDPLTFDVSGLPHWADFDSVSGTLSGVPFEGTEGVYDQIEILVSDGSITTPLAPFSITVEPAPPTNMPPQIEGAPNSAVMVGVAYLFTPDANDSDDDTLTFSIENPPSWATFQSSNGQLSGTPASSDVGDYPNVVISVSDGTISTFLPAFNIAVSQPPPPPDTPPVVVVKGEPALLYSDLTYGPSGLL